MRPYKDQHNSTNFNEIIELLKSSSSSLEDLNPLLDYIGEAKYVLLGEASHGTHEYYTWRAKITQQLVQEKDFPLWVLKAIGQTVTV